MVYNYLTKEEKILSLVYVTNYEISPDDNIQKKQFEVLKFLWDNYIKECDYYPFVKVINNKIYTIDWRYCCDTIKEQINYRTEKYLEILKVLIKELSKIYNPEYSQLVFVEKFTTFFDHWMNMDPEEFIDAFNDPFFLNRFLDN